MIREISTGRVLALIVAAMIVAPGVSIFLSGNASAYEYHEMRITWDDGAEQNYPSIHGDIIVWQDFRNGNWDIYMYNIATGIEEPVCVEPTSQERPAIYGDIIVWQDFRLFSGTPTIFMYNISNPVPGGEAVHPDGNFQTNPDIYKDMIVWRHDGQLGTFNLTTMAFNAISVIADFQFPSIDGNNVVYDAAWGDWEIYRYDLELNAEFPVCQEPMEQWYPDISGNHIVWTDWRNTNEDIYWYDINTAREHRIDTGGADVRAVVSGNTVVFTTVDGLYKYNIATGTGILLMDTVSWQDNVAIDGDRIVWFDNRNGAGDIYYMFLDADNDGVGDSEDAFPYNPYEYLDTDGDGIGDNLSNDTYDEMLTILNNIDANVTYVNGTITSIDTDISGIQAMISNLQNDIDYMNLTIQQLHDDLDYLNLTLTGLMTDLSQQLENVNSTLVQAIADSEFNILGELSLVNSSLAQGIQDSLTDITDQTTSVNASLSEDLAAILENIAAGSETGDINNSALQDWLELVLAQMDANLTAANEAIHEQLSALSGGQGVSSDKLDAINETLDELDVLDYILSDISGLGQALDAGIDEINANIDDMDTSGSQDGETGGIGLDMMLLIIILAISVISLAVNITGKRHGSDSHEVKGGGPGKDTFSHRVNEDDIKMGTIKFNTSDGKEIEITLPEPLEGDVISGTVVSKPEGKPEKQKTRNKNVLNGYVVDLEKKSENSKKKNSGKKDGKPKNPGILGGAAMDAESSEELSKKLQPDMKEMEKNIENANKVDEEMKDSDEEEGPRWEKKEGSDNGKEIKEPDKSKKKKKEEEEGTISHAEVQTPWDRLG